jgi:hypothetical protein
MAERTVSTQLRPNGPIEKVTGLDVPITEAIERWSELKLEDGSILKVKASILTVTRIPGKFDPDGNPLYVLQGGVIMIVSSADAGLKQNPEQNK